MPGLLALADEDLLRRFDALSPGIRSIGARAAAVLRLSAAQGDGPDADAGRYLNFYRHDDCPEDSGVEWEDRWSCACNDRCPACDREVEPYKSEDSREGIAQDSSRDALSDRAAHPAALPEPREQVRRSPSILPEPTLDAGDALRRVQRMTFELALRRMQGGLGANDDLASGRWPIDALATLHAAPARRSDAARQLRAEIAALVWPNRRVFRADPSALVERTAPRFHFLEQPTDLVVLIEEAAAVLPLLPWRRHESLSRSLRAFEVQVFLSSAHVRHLPNGLTREEKRDALARLSARWVGNEAMFLALDSICAEVFAERPTDDSIPRPRERF
jgi:hypothetical protein